MPKFPVDAPKARVIAVFERLGFRLVREREHIARIRENDDGTHTPLTLPNHANINGSTLRIIRTQARIPARIFLMRTIVGSLTEPHSELHYPTDQGPGEILPAPSLDTLYQLTPPHVRTAGGAIN